VGMGMKSAGMGEDSKIFGTRAMSTGGGLGHR